MRLQKLFFSLSLWISTLLILFSPSAYAETSLTLESTPGDFIGQGVTKTYTPTDGIFSIDPIIESDIPNGIEIFFSNKEIYWYLVFTSQEGTPFLEGTFELAKRYPYNEPSHPGMEITGDGRGCSELSGSFQVEHVQFDKEGNILSFAIHFTQQCESTLSPPLRGHVYYNYRINADTDGDGLTDDEERIYGTRADLGDTDRDGINDPQELLDYTNPLDRGSRIHSLSNTLCADWNGFFGGMLNVYEHVNLGVRKNTFQTSLYSLDGTLQSLEQFFIAPGAQHDHIISSMKGYTRNSYGRVCTHALDAHRGEVDGQMLYYKLGREGFSQEGIQFALAMPLTNGIPGAQFVSLNTFQPSLDRKDRPNLVTNWIHLTNEESTPQKGRLIYYNQSGALLKSQKFTLGAGRKRDFPGHSVGPNRVGLIEFRPENTAAKFQLRSVRYLYDNKGNRESFTNAVQLEGKVGSGQLLSAPVDTRNQTSVLEVANTTNKEIATIINIYDQTGWLKQTLSLFLAPHQTEHLILNKVLRNKLGSVTIKSSTLSSVLGTVMQYGRTRTGGVSFLYGISAQEALGQILRGSYNSHLHQGCRLLIGNSRELAVSVTVSATRSDGSMLSHPLLQPPHIIPAHGVVELNICSVDSPNNQGVITLNPSEPNSIVSTILRTGRHYRIPTAVR